MRTKEQTITEYHTLPSGVKIGHLLWSDNGPIFGITGPFNPANGNAWDAYSPNWIAYARTFDETSQQFLDSWFIRRTVAA